MTVEAQQLAEATNKLDEAIADYCRTVHDGGVVANWFLVAELQHLDQPAALKLAESPRMTPWLRIGVIRFLATSFNLI